MHLAVYLPLLLPALLTPLARPLSDRLHPRHATWLLTGAAAVLAASATLALALLAVSAVIRLPAVASLGHISLAELGPDTAYAMPTGLLAGILVTAATVTGSASMLRCFRGLADSYREARRLPGRSQAVVLDDQIAAAYALPGRPDTNERTWPGSITCLPQLRAWQRRPTRCCGPRPGRSNTPSSGGPMRKPPSLSGTGDWSRMPSAEPPWRPRRAARRPVPCPLCSAPSSQAERMRRPPDRYPGESQHCSPPPRHAASPS